MRLLKMACSRRKKTILYSLCLGALVYMGVQVVYFSETFTPLMMLSDAQSEARRLLKFISFYHYQCNSTLPLYNRTDWPLCVDKKYGVDIEDKRPKIAYSIGPAWDFTFERNLVYNLSYNLFMFSLVDVPRDLKEINRTHSYKTMIVANDPADYGRNSYGTQTLNSIMEAFHHRRVDILKIDLLADRSHAYELLYYMAEDHIMPRFQQLHVTVHIDKLDDDYLYRWYRAFYNLFYHEGFRLYHTSASDPLCLQVTMMESCIYYTSWIHDPGPNVFVMHPPAIDGSLEFEEQRLMDYLETEQTSCDHLKLLPGATGAKSLASWEGMAVCADKNTEGTCVAVIMSEKTTVSQLMLLGRKCEVISLVPATTMYTEPHVVMTLPRKRHMLGRLPRKKELTLREAMMVLHGLEQIDWLYMELPESASYFLTAVLDSGILHMVQQLGLDLVTSPDRLAVNVRRTFSELKRLQSQHMQIFHATPFSDAQLRYIPSSQLHSDCCHRISLQKKWKISRR